MCAKRVALGLCEVLLLGAGAGSANAALISDGPPVEHGHGNGMALTVLTLDSPGKSSSESGCVGWSGSGDVMGGICFGTGVAGGDEQSGAKHTNTITVGSAGIGSAAELRVVFHPQESKSPGGRSITIDHLVLGIFDAGGALLFLSGDLARPFEIPDVDPLHPSTVYFVFRLDAADLADAEAAFSSPNNHIGLAASVSNATGGPDWFSISRGDGGIPEAETPEPATYLLTVLGLVAVDLVRRRKRKG